MTSERLGRFSPLELVLVIAGGALTVGAFVWLFATSGTDRSWQWLMFAALITTFAGQQVRRRRLAREYGQS